MSKFTTSDNVQIYYEDKGNGKPIVFVHGWSADHSVFQIPSEYLSSKFRVITYDLRGHGASDRPEKGLTMNRFARDVEELMNYLNLKDVTFIGWSMGTSILFEYIKTFGDSRLAKAGIIDMTPKLINDENWHFGLNHGMFTMEDTLNALTTMCNNWMDFGESFAREALPHLDDNQIDPILKDIATNTPHIMYSMWLSMSVNDYRDILKDISVPVYIIYGEKSTLYSKETAQYLKDNISNAELVPFKGCTHFLPVEKPNELAGVVEKLTLL